MELLTTNIMVWVLGAAAWIAVGYAVAKGTTRKSFLISGIVAAALTICAGVVCVYFVPTDEKKIRHTVDEMRRAIVAGDLDGLLGYVGQNTPTVRALAYIYVDPHKVKVEKINVSNFKIEEINRLASPPKARVSFRATGVGVAAGDWGGAFTAFVDFEAVELRLEHDGVWRVTDHVRFDLARGF